MKSWSKKFLFTVPAIAAITAAGAAITQMRAPASAKVTGLTRAPASAGALDYRSCRFDRFRDLVKTNQSWEDFFRPEITRINQSFKEGITVLEDEPTLLDAIARQQGRPTRQLYGSLSNVGFDLYQDRVNPISQGGFFGVVDEEAMQDSAKFYWLTYRFYFHNLTNYGSQCSKESGWSCVARMISDNPADTSFIRSCPLWLAPSAETFGHLTTELAKKTSDELGPSLLEQAKKLEKEKNYCDAARVLVTLQSHNVKLFMQNNGWKKMLELLADGGFVFDYTDELLFYTIHFPKSDPDGYLRFLQIRTYADYIPEGAFNPSGHPVMSKREAKSLTHLKWLVAQYDGDELRDARSLVYDLRHFVGNYRDERPVDGEKTLVGDVQAMLADFQSVADPDRAALLTRLKQVITSYEDPETKNPKKRYTMMQELAFLIDRFHADFPKSSYNQELGSIEKRFVKYVDKYHEALAQTGMTKGCHE